MNSPGTEPAAPQSDEFKPSMDNSADALVSGSGIGSGVEVASNVGETSPGADSNLESLTNAPGFEMADCDVTVVDLDQVVTPQTERDTAVLNSGDSRILGGTETVGFWKSLPGGDFLGSPLFDDHDRKLAAMAHQASLLLERRQLGEAVEWLTVMEAECHGKSDALGACLGLQAELEIARQDHPAAQALLQRQQQLYEQAGQRGSLAMCLRKQAILLMKDRRPEQALTLLQTESQICQELGLAPDLVRSMKLQAKILASLDEFDAALAVLRQQADICRLHGFHNQFIDCLIHQAKLLRDSGDVRLAVATLNEQIRVARQIGRDEIAAIALGQQAAIHETSGDLAAAEYYYRQGEQLCRKLGRHELLARNLANQAYLLSAKMNDHREALPHAAEALTLANEHGYATLAAQIEHVYEGIRERLGQPVVR